MNLQRRDDLANSGQLTLIATMWVWASLVILLWTFMAARLWHKRKKNGPADLENAGIPPADIPLDNLMISGANGSGKGKDKDDGIDKMKGLRPFKLPRPVPKAERMEPHPGMSNPSRSSWSAMFRNRASKGPSTIGERSKGSSKSDMDSESQWYREERPLRYWSKRTYRFVACGGSRKHKREKEEDAERIHKAQKGEHLTEFPEWHSDADKLSLNVPWTPNGTPRANLEDNRSEGVRGNEKEVERKVLKYWRTQSPVPRRSSPLAGPSRRGANRNKPLPSTPRTSYESPRASLQRVVEEDEPEGEGKGKGKEIDTGKDHEREIVQSLEASKLVPPRGSPQVSSSREAVKGDELPLNPALTPRNSSQIHLPEEVEGKGKGKEIERKSVESPETSKPVPPHSSPQVGSSQDAEGKNKEKKVKEGDQKEKETTEEDHFKVGEASDSEQESEDEWN
ncbi:hypothetical protein F4808DRAFT_464208 [Astrocystis sublimbata]|nr:hypothetical protein F4808DRAFT_464208 [Astrocystis sublimbata]